MLTLPDTIIAFLSVFASEFTQPTWQNIKILLTGAIVCRGPRRITGILRVMGLADIINFSKYHRVLSRAKWNSVNLSRILFGLLIKLLPSDFPILIAVDETLERRKGKKIKAKGCYRDAVRSSQSTVVKCFGLKWECMALLVPLPFSKRPWALSFMTVLAASKKANEKAGRKHKTSIDWTVIMVKVVCRWLGNKSWILIGDGAYACIHLAHECMKRNVTLISRLRWDAQIFDFPPEPKEGQRGRKRIRGTRINLKSLIGDKTKDWFSTTINWYGGITKNMMLLSGICMWHQSGKAPVTIRYVIVVDPDGKERSEVFFSTNTELKPEKIIEYFVMRWSIEVTFEETRAHLGVETQRQWSDRAIARTTPLLMGLFSLVTLIAIELKKSHIFKPLSTAWYQKDDNATFSDVIAFVKRIIWSHRYLLKSRIQDDSLKIERNEFNLLINQLALSG